MLIYDEYIAGLCELSKAVKNERSDQAKRLNTITRLRQTIISVGKEVRAFPEIFSNLTRQVEINRQSELLELEAYITKELRSVQKLSAALSVVEVLAAPNIFQGLRDQLLKVINRCHIAPDSNELAAALDWTSALAEQKGLFKDLNDFYVSLKEHQGSSFLLKELGWLSQLEKTASNVTNAEALKALYDWAWWRGTILSKIVRLEVDIRSTYNDLTWPGSGAFTSQVDITEISAYLVEKDRNNQLLEQTIQHCSNLSWSKFVRLRDYMMDKTSVPWVNFLRYQRGIISFLFRTVLNIAIIALNTLVLLLFPSIVLIRHYIIVHKCSQKLQLN